MTGLTNEQREAFEKLRRKGVPENDWLKQPDPLVFKAWPEWRKQLYTLISGVMDKIEDTNETEFLKLNETLKILKNDQSLIDGIKFQITTQERDES